jgi:hypothetical protein
VGSNPTPSAKLQLLDVTVGVGGQSNGAVPEDFHDEAQRVLVGKSQPRRDCWELRATVR